jgi:hypothetical protein
MNALRIRRALGAAAVVVTLVGAALVAPKLQAQLSQGDMNSPDVLKMALDQQVGKRVRLKLISGQDIEGQVTRVGTHGVYITGLVGMEFYDATVKVEQIAAVIVRR